MIKISVYQVTPFLAEGCLLPNVKINNGTDWLREAVNIMYNRSKERLKVAGVVVNLFHNHDENSGVTISRYPLIQFQKTLTDFFVVGINEGSIALEELFAGMQKVIQISDNLHISVKKNFESDLPASETKKVYVYKVTNWLPFSNESYKKYTKMETLSEKISFLEYVLKNHLVKDFSQYLDLNFNGETIQVQLTAIDSFTRSCVPVKVNKYTHDFQPFTVSFSANLLLPKHICLGNGKVYGFGLVEPAP
ncbi:MAG: hypothetical protein CVU12_08620 [Bacteroidetes bacterium HGW-Bacteroidetes-7]|jgi:hypothetical protein|nr:MAG: hypothetical protein CVU12_08620 [Bacteroidetes bacterium HGW-Bacteroidetes-7]